MSNKPDDICNAIHKLTVKVGELVKAEEEQNDILRGIKNKLSDIAVIAADDSFNLIVADSEEESGLRSDYSFAKRGSYGYYYYNGNMKKKEDDANEQHS